MSSNNDYTNNNSDKIVIFTEQDAQDYKLSVGQRILNIVLLEDETVYHVKEDTVYVPVWFKNIKSVEARINAAGTSTKYIVLNNKFYEVKRTLLYPNRKHFDIVSEI